MKKKLGGLISIVFIVFVFLYLPHYLLITEAIRQPFILAIGEEYVWETENEEPDFVINASAEEVERSMGAHGATLNPIAKHRIDDGVGEEASWGYRTHPFSTYQTHFTIHDVGSKTEIHVHREWNSYRHPFRHLADPGGPDTTPDGEEHLEEIFCTSKTDRYENSLATIDQTIRDSVYEDTTVVEEYVC